MKSNSLNNLLRKTTVLTVLVCLAIILSLKLITDKYTFTHSLGQSVSNNTTFSHSQSLSQSVTDSSTFSIQTSVKGGHSTIATLSPDTDTQVADTWFMRHKDKVRNNPDLRKFLPRMSIHDELLMLITFDTFVELCNRKNLTYFLWGGSLLGAYRHHGFIPWDDDLDVIVLTSDVKETRKALSSNTAYDLYSPHNSQWKFYQKDLPAITYVKFKYPFIDIFLFEENSTHIFGWASNIKKYVYNKNDVFPLQSRVFENRLVSVPCGIETFLQPYNTEQCVSPYYLHKERSVIKYTTIACGMLYGIFPFVFRQNDSQSGNVVELLKRGDQVLQNISVSKDCM